jgi:hypothetical protein
MDVVQITIDLNMGSEGKILSIWNTTDFIHSF